jgi:hypothetical protein
MRSVPCDRYARRSRSSAIRRSRALLDFLERLSDRAALPPVRQQEKIEIIFYVYGIS